MGMRLTYLVSTTAESRQAAMSYDLLQVVDVNDFDNNERKEKEEEEKETAQFTRYAYFSWLRN